MLEEIVKAGSRAAFHGPHEHKARVPEHPRRQCQPFQHESTGLLYFLNVYKHFPGISNMTQSTCDHLCLENITKIFPDNFPIGTYLHFLFLRMFLTSK